MSNRIAKLLNILLLTAALFYGTVFLIVFFIRGRTSSFGNYTAVFVQILIGLITLFVTLFHTHRAYHMFLSLFLVFWGTIIIFVLLEITPFGFKQLWPVFGVASGIALLLTGFYKYKHPRLGFTIPSISLILMCCWFMLFSFGIITIPFKTVVLIVGPFFIIVLSVFLVALYLLQKRYKNLVVTDDTPEVFDECLVSMDYDSGE